MLNEKIASKMGGFAAENRPLFENLASQAKEFGAGTVEAKIKWHNEDLLGDEPADEFVPEVLFRVSLPSELADLD